MSKKIIPEHVIETVSGALDQLAAEAYKSGYRDGHIDAEQKRLSRLWITDREPEEDGEYLVTCIGAVLSTVLMYEGGCWTDEHGETYAVIAWTYMPEVYEVAKRESI